MDKLPLMATPEAVEKTAKELAEILEDAIKRGPAAATKISIIIACQLTAATIGQIMMSKEGAKEALIGLSIDAFQQELENAVDRFIMFKNLDKE